MGLIPLIIERLKTEVPALGGRVAGAADLGRLIASNTPPQVTPAAHVYPAGMLGGRAEPLLGIYRQTVERHVAVLLSLRAQDQAGASAIDQVEALLDAIAEAISGWVPTGAAGPFVLRRTLQAGSKGGVFSYETTFSISDELRILT